MADKQIQPVTLADLDRLHDELIAEIRVILINHTPKSLLRMGEVVRRVGFKRGSIEAKIAAGEFPAPVDLGGGRAIGFVSTEIDRWIDERIKQRGHAASRAEKVPWLMKAEP